MLRWKRGAALVAVTCGAVFACVPRVGAQQVDGYVRSGSGTRTMTLGSGTSIKMLLDATNLESDAIEVAEITFPAGASPSPSHQHGSMEIFYVVEGVLGHTVNGEEHRLEPGMVGVVKPGDEIVHHVLSSGPVKAVVVWVPGGEGARFGPLDRWTPIRD